MKGVDQVKMAGLCLFLTIVWSALGDSGSAFRMQVAPAFDLETESTANQVIHARAEEVPAVRLDPAEVAPADPVEAPAARALTIEDLAELLRQLQPREAAPKVEPLVPLAIQLLNPRDALIGDLVHFQTKVQGNALRYAWSVDPPVDGLLVLDGGERAAFSNRNVGMYRVTVSVSGADGQVAHDVATFEVIHQASPHAITALNIASRVAPPTLDDFVADWLVSVQSPTRDQEAAQLTTIMRELAAVYREGGAAATDDPLRSVQQVFEEAIGPARYAGWATFFDGGGYLRDYLADLQSSGGIETSDQWANVLENVAGVIETKIGH